jgi:hypothetical protein
MQVGEVTEGDQTKEFLISGSRDKSLMIWDIQERGQADSDKEWGVPKKVLKGKFDNSEGSQLICRTWSLYQRFDPLTGQQILLDWIMGRHPQTLGPQKGINH